MSCAVGTVTSGDPDRFVPFLGSPRSDGGIGHERAVDKFPKPRCYLRILSGHS
jgi:hypothetical protein